MIKHFFHIISALFISINAFGQPKAEAIYSNDSIRIGEQFLLDISFNYYKSGKDSIVWPEFDQFITNSIEIVKKSPIKTTLIDSVLQLFQLQQRFILTSFEIGPSPIPAIDFGYNDSIFASEPFQIIVSAVPVDTTKGIYDIKPIIEVNYKLSNQINDWFIDNWYWIAIIILLFIIVFLIYKYVNKPKPEVKVEVAKIPAHVSALNILKALLQTKAWESDDKKAYYSSVTDTVRKYLEERFAIQAMEETTVEIIKDLKFSDILSKDKFFLQEILKQADMVKFAKYKPDSQDGEKVLEKSIEFVERTKLVENQTAKKTKRNV